MRIAVLGPGPPFHGGIVGYLARLVARLEERGHDVAWSPFRRQYPSWLRAGSTQEGGAGAWLTRPQRRALFVPWSPASWRATARDLLAWRPDVLVVKYWLPFFAPGFRSVARRLRRAGVPVVYVVANVVPHERFPLAGALTRAALREADGYVVNSDAVGRDLGSLLPELDRRMVRHVAHPLLDFGAPGRPMPSRAQARDGIGIPGQARVVLCFGYVRAYKGVEHLIDAAGLLAREPGPAPHVYVVGEIRGQRERLLEQVRCAGAEDIVHVRDGFVPDPCVEAWFVAADVVVLPYVTATQSGVERTAARYGVPVVASRVGGLPETVGDGSGRLVPPGDPVALAAALRDALARETLPAPLPCGQVRASWDALCAGIEDLVSRTV